MTLMALSTATPLRNAALRGSTAGRRGVPATVTVRRTYIDDLRDELRACGQEMVIAGQRIEYADRAGRRDVLLHVAAQLVNRGKGYAR